MAEDKKTPTSFDSLLNELKSAEPQYQNNPRLQAFGAVVKLTAKVNRLRYLAYVDAGFSEEQALYLVSQKQGLKES
jgi:hypothetical protein